MHIYIYLYKTLSLRTPCLLQLMLHHANPIYTIQYGAAPIMMIEYNRIDKMGMLMVGKFKGHLMQEISAKSVA